MSAVARWNNCQPGWHESSLGVGKKKKKMIFPRTADEEIN